MLKGSIIVFTCRYVDWKLNLIVDMSCWLYHLALKFWFLYSNANVQNIYVGCYHVDIFEQINYLVYILYMHFDTIVGCCNCSRIYIIRKQFDVSIVRHQEQKWLVSHVKTLRTKDWNCSYWHTRYYLVSFIISNQRQSMFVWDIVQLHYLLAILVKISNKNWGLLNYKLKIAIWLPRNVFIFNYLAIS